MHTKHLLERNFFFFLLIAWTGIIFYLCLAESSNLPKIAFPLKDKIVHFLFYFIFVFLFAVSLKERKIIFLRGILIFAILLGLLIEFMQEMCTKSRSFDWFDVLSNAFGAGLGFFVVNYFLFSKQKNKISLK
jgi:glycopeptide antibiotics resistance protein